MMNLIIVILKKMADGKMKNVLTEMLILLSESGGYLVTASLLGYRTGCCPWMKIILLY